MRNIPLLNVDAANVFDDISNAKHQPRRGRLQAIRNDILAGYHNYEEAAPEVAGIPILALNGRQKKALIHAFEVKTAPLAKLRGDLLNRASVVRCPFCNLSESSTIDHYLPKEHWPQFAIFPLNLVPCCPKCNTTKWTKVLQEGTASRLFLHPYFDEIPEALFMRAEINLIPDAITIIFDLFRPEGMPLPVFTHLQSHFKILGLANRYRLMALEHLGGRHHTFARIYGPANDAARLAIDLNENASDLEKGYGMNYWKAILYRALANNEAFCNGGFEVISHIQ